MKPEKRYFRIDYTVETTQTEDELDSYLDTAWFGSGSAVRDVVIWEVTHLCGNRCSDHPASS